MSRGLIHDFLGMRFDYSKPGKVKISMFDYVKDIVETFPDDKQSRVAETPATTVLFEVRETTGKLPQDKANIFHKYVAKLLYASIRTRPDIAIAVAFLTTRVTSPDLDDWNKLARCVRYLKGTLELTLTLEAGSNPIVKWWIDASYAVHPDCRSHTGAMMTMGSGAVIAKSLKQKLNTRSSTEAELVGVDDIASNVIWTNYFLGEQGYDTAGSIVYQDNQSAILLEKNGNKSKGKRSKHINVRYFFVKDRIKNGEMSVEWCPTGEMLGDFFTKPLQGEKFRQFRKLILNV